jgi:predicted anti-sigma-YlaC factor YlaD
MTGGRRGGWLVLLLAVTLAAVPGCSIKKLALNGLAGALSSTGDLFASDEDPELIRDAAPFALKTIEGLLLESPEHRSLLLSACRGFTQYSYAFVDTDAMLAEVDDYRRAASLQERALRLYLRARGYGLRLLELDHPGITEQLQSDPESAAAAVDNVQGLYWTAAAWGSAITLAKDRPEIIADYPVVGALLRRALELDEDFGEGALHGALIAIESLPANMGGSLERARHHFDRAVELTGGLAASPYLALAESVSVRNQDREEFERLLELALTVDPDEQPGIRLANLIVQKRARHLLDNIDELFF